MNEVYPREDSRLDEAFARNGKCLRDPWQISLSRGGTLIHMRSIAVPELIIILGVFVASVATYVLPFYFIFKKAGYPGLVSLVMALPIVNIVVLFWFALSEWPILRELRTLRQRT